MDEPGRTEREGGERGLRGVGRRLRVVDETLRDGLQSPSAHDPPLATKIELLHAMARLGVDAASVGLPAAGAKATSDAAALAKEMSRSRLPLTATAAGRTLEADVRAIAEVSQSAGRVVEVYAFIGSSPIRQYVESWPSSFLADRVRGAADVARRANLPFCLVMEDTTRTPPETLQLLFATALDAGARRVCLCDTVGHADPWGATELVRFARATLDAIGGREVEIDWHGHDDRGLALANALAAGRAGASGIHATAGGLGERCGNVSMEHLLAALDDEGERAAVPRGELAAYLSLADRSILHPPPSSPATPTPTPEPTSPTPPAPPIETPQPLVLFVNGERVERSVLPSRTLLELLREDLRLVATKQGCDKGDCGACTVLLDGEPVLGCLTLAIACRGRSVTTVESMRTAPVPEPLLDAFDRRGAGQCGFCTSGMLLSAKALLDGNPTPTRRQIRHAISGNLCRCTGYGAIVDAVELAAAISRGEEPAGVDLPGAHVSAPLPKYEAKG